MELYDVGMSSMVAMELQALANLSLTAFDPPKQKVGVAHPLTPAHPDTSSDTPVLYALPIMIHRF
jgi:hypothetical protein